MKKGILFLMLTIILVTGSLVTTKANYFDNSKISEELLAFVHNESAEELRVIVKTKPTQNMIENLKLISQNKSTSQKIKNQLVIDGFTRTNNKVISKFDFDFETIDIIEALPYVVIKTNSSNLLAISDMNSVEYIYLDRQIISNSQTFTSDEVNTIDYNSTTHFDVTGITDVKQNYNVDGNYFTIGILEGGTVDPNEALISNNVIYINSDSVIDEHTTVVAHIISGTNGIAPNSDIVSYGMLQPGEDGEDLSHVFESRYLAGLSIMAQKDVDAINISYALIDAENIAYTRLSQITDNFISQYNIPIVIAVGNSDCGGNYICSPLPYSKNAITVGATDIYGRSLAHYSAYVEVISEYSTMENEVYDQFAQIFEDSTPDLVAPSGSFVIWSETLGEYVPFFGDVEFSSDDVSLSMGTPGYNPSFEVRGTSFAAPMVAGSILLMMDYDYTLRSNPALIKSILTVSADSTRIDNSDVNLEDGYSDSLGAGFLDLVKAFDVLSNDSYSYFTNYGDTSSLPMEFELELNELDTINFSVIYEYYQDSVGNDIITDYYDLRFKITRPSEVTYIPVQRNSANQNLINYTATETGIYTISLVRIDDIGEKLIISGAVSWDLPISVYVEPNYDDGDDSDGSGGGNPPPIYAW